MCAKYSEEIGSKQLLQSRTKPKLGKTSYASRRKAEWLLIMRFFFKSNFSKFVSLPTHICPTKNWQLFFILTHWNYSKCKDLLQTLNVYKITAKEHQVVDHWHVDQISVS